ncbi:hypothetical protein [Pseudogulbenkiania sp. NH8B]|uniref:hypothetical protein n=1 Tax=Pseudogulbenkiania sp. (strain NH8B) TaxID=748280 RepID=UPI0011D28E97|nr:hypothetical protein [Pseudogulbenkiania sp. NH8B]
MHIYIHSVAEGLVRSFAILLLVYIVASSWPEHEKGLTPLQVVKVVSVVILIIAAAYLGYLRGCDESLLSCN